MSPTSLATGTKPMKKIFQLMKSHTNSIPKAVRRSSTYRNSLRKSTSTFSKRTLPMIFTSRILSVIVIEITSFF